jgi:hypothetical protein
MFIKHNAARKNGCLTCKRIEELLLTPALKLLIDIEFKYPSLQKSQAQIGTRVYTVQLNLTKEIEQKISLVSFHNLLIETKTKLFISYF